MNSVKDYINKARLAGQTDEQIQQVLLADGWQKEQILPFFSQKEEKIQSNNKIGLKFVLPILLVSIISLTLSSVFVFKILTGKKESRPTQEAEKTVFENVSDNSIRLFQLYKSGEKIYKSDLLGQNRQELNIDYNPSSGVEPLFQISPDRKYLARITQATIKIAQFSQPNVYKEIVKLTSGKEVIDGFAWSEDNNQIAYLVKLHQPTYQEPTSIVVNLYLINRDGTNQKLVYSYTRPPINDGPTIGSFISQNNLLGLNLSKQEVYLLKEKKFDDLSDPNFLSVISLTNGKIKFEEESIHLYDPAFIAFSTDFSKLYYIDIQRNNDILLFKMLIKEFNLLTKTQKTFYELKLNDYSSLGSISSAVLAPAYNKLIFGTIKIIGSEMTVATENYIIDLNTNQLKSFKTKLKFVPIPRSVSPDGKYIALAMPPESGEPKVKQDLFGYCLFNIEKQQLTDFNGCASYEKGETFDNQQQEMEFIGWISE